LTSKKVLAISSTLDDRLLAVLPALLYFYWRELCCEEFPGSFRPRAFSPEDGNRSTFRNCLEY
jgi:hypothetical protein